MAIGVETLKRRRDFLRIARQGRSRAAPGLVVQACRNRTPGDALHVGFTASKKVGNAVARNRARRRLRALVCEVMPCRADPRFDYVLIARATTNARAYGALKRDLELALRRLSAWRGEER